MNFPHQRGGYLTGTVSRCSGELAPDFLLEEVRGRSRRVYKRDASAIREMRSTDGTYSAADGFHAGCPVFWAGRISAHDPRPWLIASAGTGERGLAWVTGMRRFSLGARLPCLVPSHSQHAPADGANLFFFLFPSGLSCHSALRHAGASIREIIIHRVPGTGAVRQVLSLNGKLPYEQRYPKYCTVPDSRSQQSTGSVGDGSPLPLSF